MRFSRIILPPLLLTALLAGCVTRINTDVIQNPPPAEKFSAFNRFEMAKVELVPPYAGQEANERALLKIQENLSYKGDPLLQGWNDAGRDAAVARTLVITPVVTEIKFIGGGARTFAGAFAGSSAVILKVTITEKETGRILATPLFYARAAAMGGAWTFGATDNLMLVRVAGRLTDYLSANYAVAVGGRTGAELPD
ncbi:MAG TPA: hypothetical protein VHN79_06480 [Lacunisphaera sp.]|nr:hypothetical protein [Lacunisphaera sp.]